MPISKVKGLMVLQEGSDMSDTSKRKQAVISISPEVHREFRAFCEQEGLKAGRAAERALADWVKRETERRLAERV
jgi:hypothetical protein